MRAEELAQQAEAQITMWELLRSPSLRMPLTIAVVMQLSQQLSGINAVFYYSTNLFITPGLSETSAKYATIGIGTVMVLMTLVSIPLMDRSGRRTLHLYGLGGMFIFSIFITISFLVKVRLILTKHKYCSKLPVFICPSTSLCCVIIRCRYEEFMGMVDIRKKMVKNPSEK